MVTVNKLGMSYVKTTQQFISEIVAGHLLDVSSRAVSPSTVSSKLEFCYLLSKITAIPAAGAIDAYTDTSPVTETTDGSHDLGEVAETTIKDSEAIYALRKIADRMRSDGNISECIQAYKTERKEFLHTSLRLFGIEKQSSSDVRGLFLNEIEERIGCCVKACRVFRSTLFPLEMVLCAEIFEGDESATCYYETIEDTFAELNVYANSLIGVRRLPGLLFRYLDLYTALIDMWSSPEFPPSKHSVNSIDELVKKIRCILCDFEKLLIDELSTGTTPETDRGIASLTKYVMHYLTHMSEYTSVLTNLIASKPSSVNLEKNIPDVEYAQAAGRTPLELHVVYIVVLLRFKIEKKSNHYYKADSTESYLFLTNNLAHIVQCIEDSPKLEDMIGIPYMNKLRHNYLKQVTMKYQSKSCDNMLQCLRNNTALRCFRGTAIYATTFKRKIKSFYSMFEEARANQARWASVLVTRNQFVPVAEELVDAYTTFLEQFNDQNDVKYSPEQIRTLIAEDFFKV